MDLLGHLVQQLNLERKKSHIYSCESILMTAGSSLRRMVQLVHKDRVKGITSYIDIVRHRTIIVSASQDNSLKAWAPEEDIPFDEEEEKDGAARYKTQGKVTL